MTASGPDGGRAPITPTRVIPRGAPLPDHPPGPDDIPPWREVTPPAATPPPPPPAQPAPVQPPPPGPVHVHVTATLIPTEPPPEPTRWTRLWAWVTSIARPWQLLLALLAAVIPIPGVGHSLGSIWAYCVADARQTFGIAYGYGLGLVPLLLASRAFARTQALRWLTASVVALIGLIGGALDWFDIVTITTGVHR